nr:hypothetical protein [bacterium]
IAPPLPRKESSQGLLVAAFDPHFKLIRNVSTGDEQMFLLTRDPAETDDVRSEYPEVHASLSGYLDSVTRQGRLPRSAEVTETESREAEKLKALGYIQ